MKIVFFIFSILLLSGCSTVIIHAPSVNFKILDKQTSEKVNGAYLYRQFDPEKKILSQTSNDGVIDVKAVTERRWHMYPFPIISGGQLLNEQFIVSHPDYDSYAISCSFTTLRNPACFPQSLKRVGEREKQMKFIWEK